MNKKIGIVKIIQDVRSISADFFLDVFFPKFCVECGGYGEFVCFECVKKIEPIKTSTCPACGKISPLGNFCTNCKKKLNLTLSGIIIAANYEAGPTREMIHHLKYSGFTELSDLLGELIVQRLAIESSFFCHPELVSGSICGSRIPSVSLRAGKCGMTQTSDCRASNKRSMARNDREKTDDNSLLVPVPLHINKQTKRGFNQSEIIAQYVSNRTKIPFKNALARIKQTESQVGLSGEERRSNLEGAFQCNEKSAVSGKTIFLVDDVTTTYSTLNECATELKSAGAKKIYGLVVARG